MKRGLHRDSPSPNTSGSITDLWRLGIVLFVYLWRLCSRYCFVCLTMETLQQVLFCLFTCGDSGVGPVYWRGLSQNGGSLRMPSQSLSPQTLSVGDTSTVNQHWSLNILIMLSSYANHREKKSLSESKRNVLKWFF